MFYVCIHQVLLARLWNWREIEKTGVRSIVLDIMYILVEYWINCDEVITKYVHSWLEFTSQVYTVFLDCGLESLEAIWFHKPWSSWCLLRCALVRFAQRQSLCLCMWTTHSSNKSVIILNCLDRGVGLWSYRLGYLASSAAAIWPGWFHPCLNFELSLNSS